ncbi:hypothetical protein [uncultured Azohydromonas sp.]|jgi:hypothetical protein|uniref:hypothetical protein n=1 Tax=uncultured Azohydromonas sp. TaxID=487342 RepID=UPI0026267819|nr:hypothetical protein [uncultured Azohydromonas sp.]
MANLKQVDARLRVWAAALVGDQVQRSARTGGERIDALPDQLQAAIEVMEVETLVQRMERSGRWKEGRVLRTEYMLAGLPERERLAYLSRNGAAMSRTSYYAYLTSAKAYVEGALSSAPAAPGASIRMGMVG